MIARLLALAVLLAPSCASNGLVPIAKAQSRYDALDPSGVRGLAQARFQLASGHPAEARAALEELRRTHPECIYLALWQQEAEIAELGLDAVWPGRTGAAKPSEEQRDALEALRQRWRGRAEVTEARVVDFVAAARLETDAPAARLLLDGAERLDPRCAWVPYARAFLAAREDDWPAVNAEIERARALDPGHLPTRWLEAWTLARGGSPGVAHEALENWLERARGDARIDTQLVDEAELDLAVTSVLEGEPKAAREWLDQLEGQLSNPARALCARASAEEALGESEHALELAQKAAELDPNALLPLVQQALLWQHWRKDPARAETEWLKVLTLARSSPELGALFERLRARVMLDRRARALEKERPGS